MKEVINRIIKKFVQLLEYLIKVIVDYFFRTENSVLYQYSYLPAISLCSQLSLVSMEIKQ